MSTSSVLVSMAPLSQEVQSVSSCCPPHLGPAISEMNSIWFKLWLYCKLGCGPPSLFLAKGNRLRKLPDFIKVNVIVMMTLYPSLPLCVCVFSRTFGRGKGEIIECHFVNLLPH